MATDEAKKGEPPEFGLNGSVLNAPGISDEVRQAYINGDALISFNFLKTLTVTSVLSFFSTACSATAVFAFGYIIGIHTPEASEQREYAVYDLAPVALLLAGMLADGLRRLLEKRKK